MAQVSSNLEVTSIQGEIFISAKDISCLYKKGNNSVVALNAVSCQLHSGDRIAVVGPSGSGKSTLLQVMGGIEPPTSGTITWPALGPRHALRPEKIGFIFQTESLLEPLNCIENVKIPLLLSHVGEEEADEAAFNALKKLSLENLANKLPEELSGGQAQRVAAARAIVRQPKVILADEPTGQLDQTTGQHLLDLLLASIEGTDTALVIATHDMTVARRMKTVWYMEHGRLEVRQHC
ncbi:ABC transporter [Thermincola ferriacetica]|uniref:ABC transporter n=1 Tax=Thermincola ferriacetica TaxID=281456 RepID=A0A0L6W269_9FIRM|nr:ABC transporter [Thermincola ferriacetica]